MRRLFLIATAWTLVMAKPELYREKEDFQYSRSSSDDGSKSGFYGAQRGNMGGNYEKAHNMDGLAQHQMSSLVTQVEGELGDASKTKTGSVFTAANSRGVYGSGNYDLSNLEGRNFQESGIYDGANSHSSLSSYSSGHNGHSSSALHSAGYTSSQSQKSRHNSGYHATGYSDQNLQSGSLHAADNVGAGTYDYGSQAISGYQAQTGYHGESAYDYNSKVDQQRSSGYGSNVQSRLVSTVPVRIVVRPGTRVTVPVAAQTYDATHSASSYDQNAINSETEALNHAGHEGYPSTKPKHYESSYSYRKEWEKHDTKPVAVPLAVPTINPFPKNSELYDDTQVAHGSDQLQVSGIDSQRAHSSSVNGGFTANSRTSSASQSRYQTGYNAQHRASSTGSNSNAYTHGAYNTGAAADLTNVINDADTRPKSYQSSFSYHKAWERQGDPYIIKPSSNGLYDDTQSSQRLTAGSTNQGAHSSHQYGSNYKQSHQSYSSSHGGAVDCDCDEYGHIRVARSYNNDQVEVDQSQSQNVYSGLEEMGQQTQTGWENLEDLGQQSQNKWDNLENLGQQTQEKWQLEDLGQQTQNKWDKYEDLGQQTQNKWDKLEDLGQQTQNKWDKSDNPGQQTQNKWDNLEELGQQTYSKGNNQENIEQESQNKMNKEEIEQKTHNKWDNLDILNQQIQNKRTDSQINEKNIDSEKTENFSQSTTSTLNKPRELSRDESIPFNQQQSSYNHGPRQIQSTWDKLDNIGTYENGNQIPYNVQSTEAHNQDVSDLEQSKLHQVYQNDNLNQEEHNITSDLEVLLQNEHVNKNKQVTQEHNMKDTSVSKNTDTENTQQTNEKLDQSVHDSTNGMSWTSTGQNQQHSGVYPYDKQFLTPYGAYGSNVWDYSGYSSGFSHPTNWKHSYTDTNTNNNNFQTYHNSQTNTQEMSMQNLWDKINNMDKELPLANNKEESNGNIYSHGYSNSQHSSQGWRQVQTYHSTQDLGVTQSIDQQHQFRSHYAGYKPWQWTTFNDISTTEKYNDQPQPQDKEHRPLDVGRGDIDDTETSQTSDSEKQNSPVVVSYNQDVDNNKRYKTLEEIEKLSLIKEVSTTIKPINYNNGNDNNINKSINYMDASQTTNQQSDSALGVISLNEQKRLEGYGKNSNSPVTSTTTPKLGIYYNNANSQVVNKEQFVPNSNEKHEFVSHSLNKSNNDAISEVIPVSGNIHNKELNDKDVQKPEEIEQQNMNQFEDLGQQSENLDQQSTWGQNMEDFGQQAVWGQNLEEFGQQSQSGWEQNLENLGQQTQTEWGSNLENLEQVDKDKAPYENLQQSTQKHLTTPLEEKQQKQDFYGEKYQLNKSNNEKHNSLNTENVYVPQTVVQKNSNAELLTPPEPTTEKPGFWKSVGSKFTSAKDSVVGWFQRS